MADAAVWSPPKVPQAARDDAFWNALVSHLEEDVPFGRAGRLVAHQCSAPEPTRAALLVRTGTAPEIVVCPEAFPFASAFGASLSVADLAVLPVALREALSEGMVSALAPALSAEAADGLAVVASGPLSDLQTSRREPDTLRWFRMTVTQLASEPIVFDAGITVRGLIALLGSSLRARPARGGLGRELTRSVDVTLGRLRLPTERLRVLETGVVIVLDTAVDRTAIRLRLDDIDFRFKREGDAWLCLSVQDADDDRCAVDNRMAENHVADPRQTAIPSPERRLDVAVFDVAVDFDIGRLTVPLADIESWKPGSLVALQTMPVQGGIPVTLRVNGRTIAAGDLVEIDGRVGVRLTELRSRA